MYKFISAEERHIDQLVPLLASTGYWDFGLQHNALNISNREFMREAVVKPYLPFTYIIVKEEDDSVVSGVVVCASKQALSNMPATNYDVSLNPGVVELFKNVFSFELTV